MRPFMLPFHLELMSAATGRGMTVPDFVPLGFNRDRISEPVGQTGLLQDRVCRAEPDFVTSFSLALEPAAGLAQERRQAAIHAVARRSAITVMSTASPGGWIPLSRSNSGARARTASK